MSADVSVVEAQRLVEDGALLLDVREDDEWAEVHAPDATHLPMSRLREHVESLPVDRPIACICHIGGRSSMVASALRDAGFFAVNVTGGMDAWEAAGLPVIRG